MPANMDGEDRPGLSDEGWSGAGPWYPPDPLDSSCPPEYVGVSLAEIFAEADAAAAAATQAPPETADAGFLHRLTPPSPPPLPRTGPTAGFASSAPLDLALPGVALASFCDQATGDDGRCGNASDDELIGILRAWQRTESWVSARRLAVIAELIRRRPAPGCGPQGPAELPDAWGKFCADELAVAMAISARAGDKKLALAYDLPGRLPGTARAQLEGAIDEYKAQIIAEATRALDAGGAAAVEALILPGIETKTPGQIRAALARAVLTVDPAAARRRREVAEKEARVELWREDAGTAALCGRDLPPAEALAADQRITAYARELKAAGLDGTMDQLRARAFLDLALGVSSLPAEAEPGESSPRDGTSEPTRKPVPGTRASVNLTVPLGTANGWAERPGEAAGFGAVDPDVARRLVRDAAADPRSTWCVTVTDQRGQPIGHGCARPARAGPNGNTEPALGDQPGHPALTLERDHGPPGQSDQSREPGGYGRWRLRLAGSREFVVDIGPVPVLHCDHRDESPGYRP
ncbi:MAG TPA: DUF222 domain-containing protein, partial [Streptosporangiaceae bacterium]|nr:DUF222 domain-containing protein [Streptosporangiaceae bacterium]